MTARKLEKPTRGRQGRLPNRGSWRPGMSGNPAGAPRRGESWREVVKQTGTFTVAEAIERFPWIKDKLPAHIAAHSHDRTLREIVVVLVFIQLIKEPDAALWNALMDRAEGKPEQPIERTWKAEIADWLRDGKLTIDQIRGELSEELFAEFIAYTGGVPAA